MAPEHPLDAFLGPARFHAALTLQQPLVQLVLKLTLLEYLETPSDRLIIWTPGTCSHLLTLDTVWLELYLELLLLLPGPEQLICCPCLASP